MDTKIAERRILSYQDLLDRQAGDSDEEFVNARKYDKTLLTQYDKHDMKGYTGNVLYVRDTVARKLATVNATLPKGLRLKVVYGYRHPTVQEKYFLERSKVAKTQQPKFSNIELRNYVHNFVAAPDVAGHPTGGAIDLTIVTEDGQELDMGTLIADYSDTEKIRTFSTGLTKTQIENRRLLHDLMIKQNFAPFYGEWWHFSYGDREWAAFYDQSSSIYGPTTFNS